MGYNDKVRDRVQKYFNPSDFEPGAFRSATALGMLGFVVGEFVVYTLLNQSVLLGELPEYTVDAVIMGISVVEILLGPLVGWVGQGRRRSMIWAWVLLGLVVTVPLFALPGPETIPDAGLCTGVTTLSRISANEISWRTAVRLSLLLICGVVCAFGRLTTLAHGLAYLHEYHPSDNLHMHFGVFFLQKYAVLLIGNYAAKDTTLNLTWLQLLLVVLQFTVTLVRLQRYPVVLPTVAIRSGKDTSLVRSMGRVLSSRVAMLYMLALSLLAAALWGFSSQQAAFVQVKYRIIPSIDGPMALLYVPIILIIILSGYMYTTPIMPKYNRKGAALHSMMMCLRSALVYVALTWWLSCSRGEMAGMNELTYSLPTCAESCGCDRPWMEFSPVCAPEQLQTYFSPCHAGCASPDTFNGLSVYSNCTCAAAGRVMPGACDDGSCAQAHMLHQLLYALVATLSGLAMVWQGTMIIDSVDKRDVSVAIGLASSMVALFVFVGAHGFYLGISTLTCAFQHGQKCLFQNEHFVPWVGYSSAVLAGLATLVSIVNTIIVRREKKEDEPNESTEDLS